MILYILTWFAGENLTVRGTDWKLLTKYHGTHIFIRVDRTRVSCHSQHTYIQTYIYTSSCTFIYIYIHIHVTYLYIYLYTFIRAKSSGRDVYRRKEWLLHKRDLHPAEGNAMLYSCGVSGRDLWTFCNNVDDDDDLRINTYWA